MKAPKERLAMYRRRIMILLDQTTGRPQDPATTDEQILDRLEKLVQDLVKSGGTISAERILTDEERNRIEKDLDQLLPDSILLDDDLKT